MTAIEIVFVVICIALFVVGSVACLMMWEQRREHKLVVPLASLACPQCRELFGAAGLATAHELRGFIDPPKGMSLADIGPIPPTLSIVCPRCSTRWMICDGKFTMI